MFYTKLKNKDIPDINELLRRQDCPGIIISDKIPKDWSVYGVYDASDLISALGMRLWERKDSGLTAFRNFEYFYFSYICVSNNTYRRAFVNMRAKIPLPGLL